MDFSVPEELGEIRAAVRELCSQYPGEYWRALEPDRYPETFVDALTRDGWLAAAALAAQFDVRRSGRAVRQ